MGRQASQSVEWQCMGCQGLKLLKSSRYSLPVIIAAFVVMLSSVCALGWLSQTVAAQSESVSIKKGLTLSPLRTELEIAPGTSLDKTLTVTNSTDKPMTVHLAAEEFSVINQQYDYAFTAESELAKWVLFSLNDVTLTTGESKTISYRVGVPLSAEPGGRYVSLFASTDTEVADGGVSSRQRIASLLYITVLGDVTRAGHLISLSSPWVVGGKSSWSVALQNTGTTHFRSRYAVSVHDILGHDTGVRITNSALILPGTVRSVTDSLPVPLLPGLYNYVYTVGLGDTPAKTETRLVLYVSPASVVIVIFVLVLIGIFVIRRRSVER